MQSTQYKVKEVQTFPKVLSRSKYNFPLSQRLKSARMNLKMSTQGVVNSLRKEGISMGLSTLHCYESDENTVNHRYPSISVLVTLAKFYGCSIDYLFGLTDDIYCHKNQINNDLKKQIEVSAEPIKWDGQELTDKQRELISAEIDFLVSKAKG
jgi:transcriptional regulator with XRE-family HTH domain